MKDDLEERALVGELADAYEAELRSWGRSTVSFKLVARARAAIGGAS